MQSKALSSWADNSLIRTKIKNQCKLESKNYCSSIIFTELHHITRTPTIFKCKLCLLWRNINGYCEEKRLFNVVWKFNIFLYWLNYATKQQWHQPKEDNNRQSANIKSSCSERTAELLVSWLSVTSAIPRSTGNKFIIHLASATYFIFSNPELHCSHSRWDLQKLVNWSYIKQGFVKSSTDTWWIKTSRQILTLRLCLHCPVRQELTSSPQQWWLYSCSHTAVTLKTFLDIQPQD